MGIVWIDEQGLDFENKRVFVRVDFNVPTTEDGTILDDSRIVAALPTLKFLLERKAKIVIGSHLGRPKGKVRKNMSLGLIAEKLQALLNHEIVFIDDCIGDGVKLILSNMTPSQIVVLENLRFHSGEEKNEDSFARMLSQNIDIYVNDAFGAIHRAHASVAMLPSLVPVRMGGLLLQKELLALSALKRSPKKPFVAILGGSKVSDKISVITKLIQRINTLIVGGAMAYTFLKAKGIPVGLSKVEDERLSTARNILEKAAACGVNVLLPIDHMVMDSFDAANPVDATQDSFIPEDSIGVDIGPKTQILFRESIACAQTIFWNGPMGVFEWPTCFAGTKAIALAVAAADAFTVVGGGDSISAVKLLKCGDKFSHISTGGGASLEFLEDARLPGLEALGYGH